VNTPKEVSTSANGSSIQRKPERNFALERLAFFSDAVFAIAITLLALEIRLPTSLPPDAGSVQLLHALLAISSKYYSYGISFLAIGLYWLGHHRMFQYISRYDSILLVLNLLLLLCIAFIPFPSSVIGEYNNQTSNVLYALTIAITGLIAALTWLYASSGGRLLFSKLDRRTFRLNLLRSFLPPILFFLSAAVALWYPEYAPVLWYLIAVLAFSVTLLTGQPESP
jgi:uncharacterized membrane protein